MGFECAEVAKQARKALGPLARKIEQHDRSLADQMRRATDSMVGNINEGAGQIGKRRVEHYRYALGSALEASSHLEGALAWGYIDDAAVPLELLSRVRAMLWRLTH